MKIITLLFILLTLSACTVSIDPKTLKPSFAIAAQTSEILEERLNAKIIEAVK